MPTRAKSAPPKELCAGVLDAAVKALGDGEQWVNVVGGAPVALPHGYGTARVCIAPGDQVEVGRSDLLTASVTVALPGIKCQTWTDLCLAENLQFNERLKFFEVHLSRTWGYQASHASTSKTRQHDLVAATWRHAIDLAKAYAIAELTRLFTAICAREDAVNSDGVHLVTEWRILNRAAEGSR